MIVRPLLPALACLALAACGGSDAAAPPAARQTAAAVAPPAGQQWTDVVARTPEGGYRMGNADAPVKLTEFGSLTCHVCADFSNTGFEALKDYVRSGTVSYEFRNFIRDGVDLTAAQLTHCAPDGAFFPLTEALYADQKQWFMAKVDGLNERLKGLETAPPAQQSRAITQALGLDGWFASRGLSTQAQARCLADTKAGEQLSRATSEAASAYDIQGTPTFLIDGRKIDGTAWSVIEPALTRAGARKG